MPNARLRVVWCMLVAASACTDAPAPSAPIAAASDPALEQIESGGPLARYVSMGTSVSMGIQSTGVNAASQRQSWVAQLAARAGTPMELPLIGGFGCKAPFAVPLASGLRTSGEPVTLPDSLLRCDPLLPGIDLPTRNVAIDGATTQDALYSTPENVSGVFKQQLYSRVLPRRTTMLHAALRRRPTFVSVELGANEVLKATSGVAIIGATIVPPSVWAFSYDALVDTVQMNVARAVLVGLIDNTASFPSFRYGYEIYADAPSLLAAFNVAVSPDCNASPNLVFVPVRIPTAVANGLGNRARGLPPFVFSCADGGTGVVDYVLTPAEEGVVTGVLRSMSRHIRQLADRRGLAYFSLGDLYDLPYVKPPFSSIALMTSAAPYGPYFSLDGVHPSAAGHTILADAAARALNRHYHWRLPDSSPLVVAR